VTIQDSAFLQPGQDDQPALLINGDAEVTLGGSSSPLSEIALGVNYNRAGAPFQGDEDADTVDEYPNEVRGLIHVTGTLKLMAGSQVRGVVVVGGAVTVVGDSTITWDPLVRQNVTLGYANNALMKVLPGSWKRIVD
jgi:hypothetical protein